MPDLDPRSILDTPMLPGNAAGAATIRDYLTRLLSELWRMGSCFDSKQPFGKPDWEGDLHAALAQAGHINSAIEDGSSLSDEEAGYALIAAAIQALGTPPDEDDRHVIEFTAEGWAIRHPLACRPNLLDCRVHKAAGQMREAIEQAGRRFGGGRFVCGVHAEDGYFFIAERLQETGRAQATQAATPARTTAAARLAEICKRNDLARERLGDRWPRHASEAEIDRDHLAVFAASVMAAEKKLDQRGKAKDYAGPQHLGQCEGMNLAASVIRGCLSAALADDTREASRG